MTSELKPNFFIVGAPKSGTTAMNDYLSKHPEIFVPEIKEVHFFGQDLDITKGALRDRNAYLALFAGVSEPRAGEASVWYLYSRTAAQEIHAFNPAAKIIVMLRDPVTMLYSQHSQFLYNGNEDIIEFREALAAEDDRKAGRRIPKSAHLADGLFYAETVKYAEQLQRYFETFGRDNVHVILYDDFRSDLAGTYRGVLQFLGVREDFAPEFAVINPNKRARSKLLRDFVQEPPESIKRLSRLFFPRHLRQRVMKGLDQANIRYEDRSPLDPALRLELTQRFAPEVAKLSRLLGHELPWGEPVPTTPSDTGSDAKNDPPEAARAP